MDTTQHTRIRILLHPLQDERLIDQIVGALESAAVNHPEHFDKVKDRPNTIDHYGFHTDLLSAVIFSKEAKPSIYYRLTIHVGQHSVFDHLAALVATRLGFPPC